MTGTSAQHTLVFMGTSAACGVPAPYCGCAACEEAREHPEYARGSSSILIRGEQDTLIDTAPDLRLQLVREGIGGVDRVLFTHEHFDHVGGLPHLEYYARLITKQALPVYAGAICADYLRSHFDFMVDALEITEINEGDTMTFDGVNYKPLAAAHAPGTLGFLITTASTKIAYFPDTGPLSDEVMDCLHGVDILIIDATFNGNNWMPTQHHTIDGALELAEVLDATVTYLTHLSMSFDTPITAAQLQEKLAAHKKATGRDVRMPVDGLSLSFA